MSRAVADLVVVNADIRTMDPLRPRARALAARDGRIVALGDDDDAVRDLGNGETRLIDAGGRLVLPGFQDTHIHLQDSGTDFANSADLGGIKTVEGLQEALRTFAATHPEQPWVRGVGWDSAIFTADRLNRSVIDVAVPDRPVHILASDYHNSCVNSKACAMTGLAAGTADPPNGHFVKDAGGEPTGMCYEDAVFWVFERMPDFTEDDYAAGVRYGARLANRHGITGVLDALVGERHMRVYTGLDEAGALNLRVRATAKVYPSEDVDAALERVCALRRTYRTPRASVHSAKFFLDGVIENRTAAMLEDFSDATGGNAPIMFDLDQLRELFVAFDRERFQIHIHTIGDRAVRVALDTLQAAREANGPWPSLHQLAHLQIIDPADVPRFRDLGAVANFQPLWACPEPAITEATLPVIGEERGRWVYPVRSVIETGAPYAISSDWGVSTLNPFPIMQTAVTRRSPDAGPDGEQFLPEQCITVEDVVRGYTVNASAGAWRADETGSLSPGKACDLIVLDRDVFSIAPHEIGGTQVELTLLGGDEVHRSDTFDG